MMILKHQKAVKTYPTGNPDFSVMQGFPAGFKLEETDPFLMCDHFGPTPSEGLESDPDSFSIPWHPHRGMDILTYLIEGVGRHADSLGNRSTFESPGLQWICVGSGIEHAEGGGTPAGQNLQGFQIWINVPGVRRMEDPRYGTEPPSSIPTVQRDGFTLRLIAGQLPDLTPTPGPFQTTQPVQIVDLKLEGTAAPFTHQLAALYDNCLVYVYKGSGRVGSSAVKLNSTLRLDATQVDRRSITFSPDPSPDGLAVLIFAGQRINERICWRGPFVTSTAADMELTLREYYLGTFLKKRASWDYKVWASRLDHQ